MGQELEEVLHPAPTPGAVDLAMDPHNRASSTRVLAGAAQLLGLEQRRPRQRAVRSRDGGAYLEELSGRNGLPTGMLGKLGVSGIGRAVGPVWR